MMNGLLMLPQFLFGIVQSAALITLEGIRYGFSHDRILAGPDSPSVVSPDGNRT